METIEFIKSNANADFAGIRTALYKQYIKTSYEPKPASYDDQRIILTSTKFMRNGTKNVNALFSECNGLILNVNDWKPICIPLPSFKTQANTSECNNLLKNSAFDIYPVKYGTSINMYYWNPDHIEETEDNLFDLWRISTTKGFDVTNLKWNNMTYKEALFDIFDKLSINKLDFYKSLSCVNSYTFGFYHCDFHPFFESAEQKVKFWFIQSANLETFKHDFENSPHTDVKSQSKLNFKPLSMQMLYRDLLAAYDLYETNKVINYGYILRLKKFTHKDNNQHILLESSLLRKIRSLYHDEKHTMISKNNNYVRDKYVCVNSFLDLSRNKDFITLFPQYLEKFQQLGEIVKNLTNAIIEKITSGNIAGDDLFMQHVNKLSAQIDNLITIDKSELSNIMLTSFLMNIKYTDMFYQLLK